jgi:predicted GNAT family acetyltransferase
MSEISVSNDAAAHRYVAHDASGAVAGFVDYQETSELVVLTHTEVHASHEGMGVGSALSRAALEDVRERGLKALVTCPFIIGWLQRHREYVDVLYNAPAKPASDGAER